MLCSTCLTSYRQYKPVCKKKILILVRIFKDKFGSVILGYIGFLNVLSLDRVYQMYIPAACYARAESPDFC
jgi:hypothetical protein